MNTFNVVAGCTVDDILASSRTRVLAVVEDTYHVHDMGRTINPDSYLVWLPDRPGCHVVALPAYLGGAVGRIGVKWAASFPDAVSSVLLLNDDSTGHPVACIEAAGVGAACTAASAAVAASALTPVGEPLRLCFVGSGAMAKTTFDYLLAAGLDVDEVVVFDRDEISARRFVDHVEDRLSVCVRAITVLADGMDADLVVFATTAVPGGTMLRPGQIVLNVSLRDLPPELSFPANNIVDDVEHCLKADATIGGLLRGEVVLDPTVPTIVSPFGLGVLDVAVGDFVLTEALRRGKAIAVPGFFGHTR